MQRPFFIAVEGPIGVGKTTCVRFLQDMLETDMILESFDDNPFLADFYKNRDEFAFKAQMHFLLARFIQMKSLNTRKRPLISDYLFEKDRIFAELNIKRHDHLNKYFSLFAKFSAEIPRPDLVIYLKAELNILLERIEKRGRCFEAGFDANYLSELCAMYDSFFATYRDTPLFTFDVNSTTLFYIYSKVRQFLLSRA